MGNRIGTNAAGDAAVANGSGGVLVEQEAYYNIIGVADAGNVISGNDGPGVRIDGTGSDYTSIGENLIGVAADGTTPLPNAGPGVEISGGPDSSYIYDNVIAHNAGDQWIRAFGGSPSAAPTPPSTDAR